MDHDALPALMDVMEAAGFHDLDRVTASLDRAEAALPNRFHQSRAAMREARGAAKSHQWARCWVDAYRAMQTLTGPCPPDLSKCPPRPDDAHSFARAAACSCGADLPPGVRFCAMCGAPVTPTPSA